MENVTLTTAQLPVHNHPIIAVSEEGNVAAPAGAYLANTGVLDKEYKTTVTGPTTVQMNPATVGSSGSSQAFPIVQPILTINFCISWAGVFPSQT
ncbi:phage tail protein [Niabella hibiscisoli]|uniref:phage tail protein n=1 Tax=Niabella hibiscisoli TaxID=1825928 RepID=UPI001F0F56C1|nr:hypothetical protein [Niabella hibiscisoli]MCH5715925.1 hypothetical protein [Niabella hibiscisoli]